MTQPDRRPADPPPAASGPGVPTARAARAAFDGLVRDVRSLNFDTLFPVRPWLKDRAWNLLWVRWTLVFALGPFVLLNAYRNGIDLREAAWAFGVYFSMLWAMLFYSVVRPGRLEHVRLTGVALITTLVGIPFTLFVSRFPLISLVVGATDSGFLPFRAVAFVLGVGVVEEAVKSLPVWWLYFLQKRAATPRETAFICAVSGLAFGVAESVAYSLSIGALNVYGRIGEGDTLALTMLRLISTPFLHAVWSAIVGYFIGLAMLHRAKGPALYVVGVGAAALLHGLYDTLAGGWGGVAVVAASVLIFIGYVRSADQIAAEVAASVGGGGPGTVG